VVWTGGPAGDGCAEAVEGVIFSNELVDALPFHRVRAGGDGLKEIYVDHRGGRFTELPGPPSLPELARYFQEEGVCLEEGQTAEVNLQAGRWMQEVAGRLKRGFVLTVDYGATSAELYTPSRYHGTMRCFERHNLVDNPYEAIGRRDITANVNFSSLIRWGEQAGLKTAGLVTQADFLINTGILELIRGNDDYRFDEKAYRDVEAVKKLILPGSMGRVFRVLIQCRGFAEAPPLRGTSSRLFRTGFKK
jgi:SAM-dependent MidA family methyltransferase